MNENELQRIEVEKPFVDSGLMIACGRPGQRLEPHLREQQRSRVEDYPFSQPLEPGLHKKMTSISAFTFQGINLHQLGYLAWERFVKWPPPLIFSAEHTCK